MAQPAPQPTGRNWTPIMMATGGCGCLVLLCAFLISAFLFASAQGLLSFGSATLTATPTLQSIATPALVTVTPPRPQPSPTRPQPTTIARTTPTPSSGISSVVMAKDTQGDAKDPVDITAAFAPTQKIFHAVVAVVDLPANTKLKAIWYVVDVGSAAAPNSKIDEFELTTDGTRNVDFTLTVGPSGRWPVGRYKVEIYMNGSLERTVNFRVQ